MSWDDRIGERVGGGWTRLYGSGTSVDYDPRREPVKPLIVEPQPVSTADLPDETVEDAAPGWEPVDDEPIVAFARDVLGFDLWPAQAAVLSLVYREDVRVLVFRAGRRSGKDRAAATLVTYESTVHADVHLRNVPPGEQVAMVIVATSQRQARRTLKYVRSFLASPKLTGSVRITRDTEDELELSNGIVIEAVPCTARSTRGSAAAVLVMTEAGWFIDTDGSPLAAKEVWDALAPAVAQFPEGRILVLSSPRWSSGWFADMCRQASSGDFADMRHVWATTAQCNPRLASSGFLERERARDPLAFRREYEAAFTSAIGAVFPDDLVRAAVRAQPPAQVVGSRWAIAIDAAYKRDVFSAVGGFMRDKRLEVHHVEGWTGKPGYPLDHDQTLDKVAALSRSLGGAPVILDQFAAEPVAQGLQKRGVNVHRRPWTNENKADAVTIVRQLLHGANVDLPRHGPLIAQLVTYEQTALPSGRVRYSAPPGGHDDYCTALLSLALHFLGSSAWGSGDTRTSWIA